MVKASTMDLLREICRLGQGEIPEHKLLHNLDISHGYFCKLRKQLTDAGRLLVTHPNRKAHYNVRLEWTNELLIAGAMMWISPLGNVRQPNFFAL